MTLGRPGGEDQPMVYSGTLVVQGQGLAEVRSTGPRTEMGKIGTVLTSVERSKTRLKVRSTASSGISPSSASASSRSSSSSTD